MMAPEANATLRLRNSRSFDEFVTLPVYPAKKPFGLGIFINIFFFIDEKRERAQSIAK